MPPAPFSFEPMFAASYAVLLLLAAAGLEWMGRHSHRRSRQYHTRGFRFHKHTDHWECPEGARLLRAEIDNELRVVRYRAPAHTCNACAIKEHCTDSTSGREIEMAMDPWLSSATGRFHRGISLTLVVLAALIFGVELVRYSKGAERWMLAAGFTGVSALALYLMRNLAKTPAPER